MTADSIIQQQIDYYRARAGEYDQWFYRQGRYDHGEELNQRWFDEVAVMMREVQALEPVEHALELAAGTGIWTEQLLSISQSLTVIDTSPEVLQINRDRVRSDRVEYVQGDLFEWEPERQYDLVFFSFWLSHVPPERFDDFMTRVSRAVRPGGRLFIIDSLYETTSPAVDNPLREDEHIYRTRKLNDGSEYTIVKVFYEPFELQARLAEFGIEGTVESTGRYFFYASALKR